MNNNIIHRRPSDDGKHTLLVKRHSDTFYSVHIEGMTNYSHLCGRMPDGTICQPKSTEEAVRSADKYHEYWVGRVMSANAGPSKEYIERYGTANE